MEAVRKLVQISATIGREFSYEVIAALSPTGEETLQAGLQQLVNTELVYHRGLGSPATYIYRHALIQDTAYQSLFKSKRQQYHQQIAQVLEARFAETVVTQPELVAHHYTDASLISQVIPYWQQAGQRAAQRSANAEAVSHFTTALEPLQTLPDRPECNQHELSLDVTLGVSIMAAKGFAAPEVGNIYRRARELCEQVGTPLRLLRHCMGCGRFLL